MLSSIQKFKCISVQVFKQFMNDSESSTESLRKKISHSRDNFMLFFSGLMNGKSASSDKQDENDEEFDIVLQQYPVSKDHKDHTFNKQENCFLEFTSPQSKN